MLMLFKVGVVRMDGTQEYLGVQRLDAEHPDLPIGADVASSFGIREDEPGYREVHSIEDLLRATDEQWQDPESCSCHGELPCGNPHCADQTYTRCSGCGRPDLECAC